MARETDRLELNLDLNVDEAEKKIRKLEKGSSGSSSGGGRAQKKGGGLVGFAAKAYLVGKYFDKVAGLAASLLKKTAGAVGEATRVKKAISGFLGGAGRVTGGAGRGFARGRAAVLAKMPPWLKGFGKFLIGGLKVAMLAGVALIGFKIVGGLVKHFADTTKELRLANRYMKESSKRLHRSLGQLLSPILAPAGKALGAIVRLFAVAVKIVKPFLWQLGWMLKLFAMFTMSWVKGYEKAIAWIEYGVKKILGTGTGEHGINQVFSSAITGAIPDLPERRGGFSTGRPGGPMIVPPGASSVTPGVPMTPGASTGSAPARGRSSADRFDAIRRQSIFEDMRDLLREIRDAEYRRLVMEG